MNTRIITPVLISLFLACSGTAYAEAGKITISAPEDGSSVAQNEKVEITYEVKLGPNGDHVHLYLDDKRVDVLRQLKGKAEVGMIPSGKHRICLTENSSGHVPTGPKACIDINSK